jgi:hypothetical protein
VTGHAVTRRLASAPRKQTVKVGAGTPSVRGAQWRMAEVATVGGDGTVTTTDGIVARRLESYQTPASGDLIAITSNGSGGYIAWGRTAT